MKKLIRIPRRFFDDHCERELPFPEVLAESGRTYTIDSAAPEIAELLSDARHYASGVDQAPAGLVTAAKALIRAIERSR